MLFIVMVRRERKKELLLTIDAMLMLMIMNHDDAKESIAQTERKAACEKNIFAKSANYEGVTSFVVRCLIYFNLEMLPIICSITSLKLLTGNYILVSPTHLSLLHCKGGNYKLYIRIWSPLLIIQ